MLLGVLIRFPYNSFFSQVYGFGGPSEEGPHFQYVPDADVYVQDEDFLDVSNSGADGAAASTDTEVAAGGEDLNAGVNSIKLDLDVPREPTLTGMDYLSSSSERQCHMFFPLFTQRLG